MDCCIVIPARMGSTRFPGKPLCDLLGKPMIQWVVEAAKESRISGRIIVATPDGEIIEACNQFGAEALLTRADHPTGTDRIAEISHRVVADVYVNVQGDEPLIQPQSIANCARPLLEDSSIPMGTLFSECRPHEWDDPSVVKITCDLDDYALYFSRYPIPYPRNTREVSVRKHVGIYAYRREVVQAFATWEQTPLERAESLEQLRFMEHGVKIKVSQGQGSEVAVDTPDQADEVRRILLKRALSTSN